MHPEICRLGPVTIHSYGVMLAVAVLVCAWALSREAPAKGYDKGAVIDLIVWTTVAGIVAARLWFVALHPEVFKERWFEVIMVQHGGLAWQGGFIGGLAAMIFFIKRQRWPLWATLDWIAPYAALGQAIGRLGCFLQGCCYGKPSSMGMFFPVHQERLIPTQLWASFELFAVFVLLKLWQRRRPPVGSVVGGYLILASGQRFINEFFRGDTTPGWGPLTLAQTISVGFATVGLFLVIGAWRRERRHSGGGARRHGTAKDRAANG